MERKGLKARPTSSFAPDYSAPGMSGAFVTSLSFMMPGLLSIVLRMTR